MGERVYAIGAPAGLELTLSEGLVSGLRRYSEVYVIQTTAPVSHGSSGGGLFDSRGQLIGITTYILKEGQNLNFAMPTEWVQALEKHLVQQEHVARSSGVGFEALTWWQLGIKAFQAGDYKQAVRAFESALRYDPENPYLWTDLGVMYSRQGHYEDAVRSHRTAIELKSDHNVLWSNLCGAYTGLQKYRQALEACREGMRLEKNDYMLWYNYGGALLGSKLFVQAEIAYKKSVDLRPDYASAWINLGTVYSEMGTIWHSQAIQAYQEGLRLEPDNATGWYNLGLVYHELGDRSRVLRVYQRLKSLDRGMADKFFRQVVLP
jgi:tetratricopeptide (TPR) repeat protein